MNDDIDIEIDVQESAAQFLRGAQHESAALKARISNPQSPLEQAHTAVELCDLLDWCQVLAGICRPSFGVE